MKGLLFSKIYLDQILNGDKTFDTRMHPCMVRGPIALVESESRLIRGTAEIVDVRPIPYSDFVRWHSDAAGSEVPLAAVPSDTVCYAYDLENVRKLRRPADSYDSGSHMWTYIPEEVQHLIGYRFRQGIFIMSGLKGP